PVVLPSIRDPRLHVAAVIISVHVLGQVGLHFAVSVPQILAAILTCAILEIAITFAQTRSIVWPASAMLTGSGVALILRVVGTPPDSPWDTHAWYAFAAIAGLSLLTKYVIRYRGAHVFNPSNIGLVLAFVVLGSTRVEPLDFWWAPLNLPMIAAYAAIVGGGLLITRRLRLLGMAISFWLAFAAGTAILAASGHCMTARWSFAPVCGFEYWRVIVTSPEVMIFLFFMITDPRTSPAGRVGRVVFGVLVAAASVLLLAPQANEFGAKVGLLAGLLLVCAARPLLERVLPEPKSPADDLRRAAAALGLAGRPRPARTALGAGAALTLAGAIVLAGIPARGLVLADPSELLNEVPHQVDPATFPAVTVQQDVADWNHEIAGPEMQGIVRTLAENLELESQALLRRDGAILEAVDHGDRLAEMQERLRQAQASGTTTIERYRFESINVALLVPFGVQTGLSLGFQARGSLTTQTYDADGRLHDESTSPFSLTFAMRQATGSRWMNVAVLPFEPGSAAGSE
ncbi:MAG TPA: RnfABCDGE type electron transport complex subunit D, partial [Candidatus Limnocylindria bacterium]